MNSGKKENLEKLVIVSVKDQGQKSMKIVQKNDQSKMRPEEKNDREAEQNEENRQNQ